MEDGIYRARGVSAALGETKGGKEQVGIEFELLDHSSRITYYGYFTDKSTEHTIKALRAAGWKGEDLSDLSSIGADGTPEVSLVLENEEYEGKWHTKVKWVNAAGGVGMKTPLAGDKAKAFAARMRGAVLAHDKAAGAPKVNGTPSRQPVLSPEPPPNLDEPPF